LLVSAVKAPWWLCVTSFDEQETSCDQPININLTKIHLWTKFFEMVIVCLFVHVNVQGMDFIMYVADLTRSKEQKKISSDLLKIPFDLTTILRLHQKERERAKALINFLSNLQHKNAKLEHNINRALSTTINLRSRCAVAISTCCVTARACVRVKSVNYRTIDYKSSHTVKLSLRTPLTTLDDDEASV
jgi:hypothetical protein